MIGVGLVGFGYWGPNLARNFNAQPDARLLGVCELAAARREKAGLAYPGCRLTDDYRRLLEDGEVSLVIVATPTATHFEVARAALEAGRDVLLCKPMTESSAQAGELIELARKRKRILAVDHTFLFTGAVRKIKEIVAAGEIGELVYFDSVRVNLGQFQPDVNVIYDLAPHDISILGYLIGDDPSVVQAMGSTYAGTGLESHAYIHLEYGRRLMAHFHLNWLAPVKLRRILIGGTRKMIVYDDGEPSEKVKVYDKGVVIKQGDLDAVYRVYVDYRTGDMVAPKLAHGEALAVEARHVLDCVRDRTPPLADGLSGLRVVRILEAAQESIKGQGRRVALGK